MVRGCLEGSLWPVAPVLGGEEVWPDRGGGFPAGSLRECEVGHRHLCLHLEPRWGCERGHRGGLA